MPVRGRLTTEEKLAAQYLALGMSLTQAADTTGLGLDLLRNALRHPLMEQEIEACKRRAFPVLADRLARRLEETQEPALNKMAGLLDAESEGVQFQAARDLLNRGPLAPKMGLQSQQQPGLSIHLDQSALHAILAGALNAGNQGIVAAFASLSRALPAPETPSHE
jgi:hypothetical protein